MTPAELVVALLLFWFGLAIGSATRWDSVPKTTTDDPRPDN